MLIKAFHAIKKWKTHFNRGERKRVVTGETLTFYKWPSETPVLDFP